MEPFVTTLVFRITNGDLILRMIIRKIALAIASAMVLSLATEIIKILERKLGNNEKAQAKS